MKRCLSCGNEIEQKETIHKACLKQLFGVNYLPKVNFSLKEISIKAQEMSGKLSISGVQPKLSMKLDRKAKTLIVVPENGEYILKPQIMIYPNIPQNENLCMTIAHNLGINIPPQGLIKLKDDTWAYIIKRFDRQNGEKIHQEDFFQILGKEDKYSGSFEEIGKRLKTISEVPGLDTQLFYERVLFNFIIGNGDAHLKNFSVIYDNTGGARLSPAYDIVSSKLVISSEEDSALTINGKKNKITAQDLYALAKYLNIPEKVTNGMFLNKKDIILNLIKDSILEDAEKNTLIQIITERFARLS